MPKSRIKLRNRASLNMGCLILLAGIFPLALSADDPAVWIDLTHELSSDAVFWPTAEPFSMTTDFEGMTEKGYFYSAYSFKTAEHGGTHIDAPVHFAAGANPVNEIPLDQLIGDVVLIDVSEAVGIDTASIDRGKSTHFEAHVALMTHNGPAFENVANLDQLPATGVFVIALPVKIRGGSGGPLRIIATVREN